VDRGNAYTIIFALIICIVASSALTLVSKGLEPKKNFNIEIDRKKNVLKAFGVDIKGKKSNDIMNFYNSSIEEYVVDKGGNKIEGKKPSEIDPVKDVDLKAVYKGSSDEVTGFAVPVVGPGLWGTMYGYLALENDLNTIKGISFYRHQETPGLGGEIEAEWFTKNFAGKKICDDAGSLKSIRVIKGSVKDVVSDPLEQRHCVDGISGATMTSDGVTETIKSSLENFEPHFQKIRKGL
jgi:Na+-transporting NADH:ubiquinone oxidoreductase subunit C